MEHHKTDVAVVGAGVVGLAIARALLKRGREVTLLEAQSAPACETSSRNSGVIHAGIYYPKDSLKAQLCIRGKPLLYDYCRERGVTAKMTGKLIVAEDTEEAHKLTEYHHKGRANGNHDLRIIKSEEIRELEPNILGHAALLSPSTGVLDVYEFARCLEADIINLGGEIIYNTQVTGIAEKAGEFTLTHKSDRSFRLKPRLIVNACGHHAHRLARQLMGERAPLPPQFYAKGHYYKLRGPSPFKKLIYPLPSFSGLGIHATTDTSGVVRFGPDVTWVEKLDYDFDSTIKGKFVKAIERYYPLLNPDDLHEDYCGVRPKFADASSRAADFHIQVVNGNRKSGLVNLMGIESPGLTSVFAIAEHVVRAIS